LSDAQVTIVIPSLNQGRYLDDALTSVFQQDLPVEVFVMDGGSSDDSVKVIKKWKDKLAGWRSQPDEGQAAAINEGIASGSAPLVCWLNSDDFLYTGGLKQLIKTLQERPERHFVYGRCWTVSKTGRKVSPYLTRPFSPGLFANFCFVAQPATLVTRRAWEQLNGLDANMQMAFDYDLWWRLYHAFGVPGYCKQFVAATRWHKDTKTATQSSLHYRESIKVVEQCYGSVPFKWRVALPLVKVIHKWIK